VHAAVEAMHWVSRRSSGQAGETGDVSKSKPDGSLREVPAPKGAGAEGADDDPIQKHLADALQLDEIRSP
jgi:hypothetical protein